MTNPVRAVIYIDPFDVIPAKVGIQLFDDKGGEEKRGGRSVPFPQIAHPGLRSDPVAFAAWEANSRIGEVRPRWFLRTAILKATAASEDSC